jgi:hypothetical protein
MRIVWNYVNQLSENCQVLKSDAMNKIRKRCKTGTITLRYLNEFERPIAQKDRVFV